MHRSIMLRLSLLFIFLMLLVGALGGISLASLSYFKRFSSEVSGRWLPSTRLLGNLDSLTSDYRAAEAASLLAGDSAAQAAYSRQMQELDRGIAAVLRDYARIPHDATERAQYATFSADWRQYLQQVGEVRSFTARGDRPSAVHLYNTASRRSYAAADAALDAMKDRNMASADRAALRENTAYTHALWLMLPTMFLAIALMAAATLHVRRTISQPLLALAGRMRRIAMQQTATPVEGTDRQDEIGEMARAVVVFRDNAIELINSRRGLAQQARMLQEKLAEEHRLMLMQRSFVSMASHEFRTPLSTIDARAQYLLRARDHPTAEDLQGHALKIRSAVARMTHLIDHLLDSSKLRDGDIRLYVHAVEMDVARVVHEVCQLQRDIVPQAQILECGTGQPLIIRGDPDLLFQVFNNLVSNAIKYSPRGSLVKVTAAVDAPGVLVSVEDQGIGIRPEDQPRVFEHRFRGSNTAGIAGTGIGLSFVSMVVQLHAGRVELESWEGQGSRFTVRLPAAPAGSDRQPPARADPEGLAPPEPADARLPETSMEKSWEPGREPRPQAPPSLLPQASGAPRAPQPIP